MAHPKILLLDLHRSKQLGETLIRILASSFRIEVYSPVHSNIDGIELDGGKLRAMVARADPDLTFLVAASSTLRQAETLKLVAKLSAASPLIIVMDEAEPRQAFELLKLGVADYLAAPLDPVDVLPRVWRLSEKLLDSSPATAELKERLGLKQIVGESPAFVSEMNKIPPAAKCDVGVLISGETGTGKELYARAIHYLSPRASGPFVPVNCGAIPAELVENELFGHTRGAFTGATTAQHGLLREAEGGTLFLDEIDCLPLLAQTKLLRFLQEKEYRPLGSAKLCRANVRVIAASNADFRETVRTGKLRQDLYYRLNVLTLALPPLRERAEDIPLLAAHFLKKFASEFDKPVAGIAHDAIRQLTLYGWPGNVRELEHVIERAVVLSETDLLRPSDLNLGGADEETDPLNESFQQAKANFVRQFERGYIQKLLLAHSGNITRAARAASKNRRAFWQLIQKHKIDMRDFKPTAS
jgi:DNA-binding NtrC family response regulator